MKISQEIKKTLQGKLISQEGNFTTKGSDSLGLNIFLQEDFLQYKCQCLWEHSMLV
jgi:hypothetical protein